MTRFWINIDQGINLVEKSFSRMIGGEIFIPIIPSIKITDLAKAMAPTLKHKVIGISRQCYKTKKYYKKNKLNEVGKLVKSDFEYNSGTNKKFLTISEIRKMNLYNKIDTFSGTS